jgi:hypothetical protein
MDHDDETPARSPRSKSSVSVKTAELVAERISLELNTPMTTPQREHIGDLLQAWLEQQLARRMKLEREEHERVKKDLVETQAARNKLASLLAKTP